MPLSVVDITSSTMRTRVVSDGSTHLLLCALLPSLAVMSASLATIILRALADGGASLSWPLSLDLTHRLIQAVMSVSVGETPRASIIGATEPAPRPWAT
jgi:hypothetical protein